VVVAEVGTGGERVEPRKLQQFAEAVLGQHPFERGPAHPRRHHQPQMIDAQLHGDQAVLRGNHIVIGIPGEFHVQAIAGLACFSITHLARN